MPYPQSAPPRVAYIEKVAPGFEVRLLDAASSKTQDLLHLVDQPGPMSVARHGQVLLVFGDSALHVLDLQSQKQEEIPALPDPVPPANYLKATPETAGYLDDGSLVLVMRSDDKTSDMVFFLFQRTADGWKALETSESCGYYRECLPNYGFKHHVDTRGPGGDDPTPILGKSVEHDPFFLSRSPLEFKQSEDSREETEGYGIRFDFGASHSTLVYTTDDYPDIPGQYISYLALQLPGQKLQVICPDQCGGEIMGRYLLTGRLIDLSNGKILLDDGGNPLKAIRSAIWVY